MTYRRITTMTLRVVEEFHDDDTDEMPSLPAQHAYDTTCHEVTETRGLAKCGPVAVAIEQRRKAGAR